MATNSDTFTYANGELGLVSGGLWIRYETGLTAVIDVNTNKLQNGGAPAANSVYVYNATYANGQNIYSQAVFDTLGAGWEMGLLLNMQDPGSSTWDGYIFAAYDAGGGTINQEVYRTTNRTTSVQLGTTSHQAISAGDVFKFTNEAGTLKVYQNGVQVSGPGGADATYTAATVGLYLNSSGLSAWRLDTWEGGDLSAPPEPNPSGFTRARPIRPAPFKPIGDGFRSAKYRGWR